MERCWPLSCPPLTIVGMFEKIWMFQNIPENVRKGFRGILKKIPRNITKDFLKCPRRFRETFGKILGNIKKKLLRNVRKDPREYCETFWESKFGFISWYLAFFYQVLQSKCYTVLEKQQLSNSSERNILYAANYNWSPDFNYWFS